MVIKCAVCRYRKQKCVPGCIFFPYLPEDQVQKFHNIRVVHGIDKLTTQLTTTLNPDMRQQVVDNLNDRALETIRALRGLQNPNLEQHNEIVQKLNAEIETLRTQTQILINHGTNHTELVQGKDAEIAVLKANEVQKTEIIKKLEDEVAVLTANEVQKTEIIRKLEAEIVNLRTESTQDAAVLKQKGQDGGPGPSGN